MDIDWILFVLKRVLVNFFKCLIIKSVGTVIFEIVQGVLSPLVKFEFNLGCWIKQHHRKERKKKKKSKKDGCSDVADFSQSLIIWFCFVEQTRFSHGLVCKTCHNSEIYLLMIFLNSLWSAVTPTRLELRICPFYIISPLKIFL